MKILKRVRRRLWYSFNGILKYLFLPKISFQPFLKLLLFPFLSVRLHDFKPRVQHYSTRFPASVDIMMVPSDVSSPIKDEIETGSMIPPPPPTPKLPRCYACYALNNRNKKLTSGSEHKIKTKTKKKLRVKI